MWRRRRQVKSKTLTPKEYLERVYKSLPGSKQGLNISPNMRILLRLVRDICNKHTTVEPFNTGPFNTGIVISKKIYPLIKQIERIIVTLAKTGDQACLEKERFPFSFTDDDRLQILDFVSSDVFYIMQATEIWESEFYPKGGDFDELLKALRSIIGGQKIIEYLIETMRPDILQQPSEQSFAEFVKYLNQQSVMAGLTQTRNAAIDKYRQLETQIDRIAAALADQPEGIDFTGFQKRFDALKTKLADFQIQLNEPGNRAPELIEALAKEDGQIRQKEECAAALLSEIMEAKVSDAELLTRIKLRNSQIDKLEREIALDDALALLGGEGEGAQVAVTTHVEWTKTLLEFLRTVITDVQSSALSLESSDARPNPPTRQEIVAVMNKSKELSKVLTQIRSTLRARPITREDPESVKITSIMDKDLYGILTLDSRVRGNDKNDKSRDYDSHPRDPESKKCLSIIDVKILGDNLFPILRESVESRIAYLKQIVHQLHLLEYADNDLTVLRTMLAIYMTNAEIWLARSSTPTDLTEAYLIEGLNILAIMGHLREFFQQDNFGEILLQLGNVNTEIEHCRELQETLTQASGRRHSLLELRNGLGADIERITKGMEEYHNAKPIERYEEDEDGTEKEEKPKHKKEEKPKPKIEVCAVDESTRRQSNQAILSKIHEIFGPFFDGLEESDNLEQRLTRVSDAFVQQVRLKPVIDFMQMLYSDTEGRYVTGNEAQLKEQLLQTVQKYKDGLLAPLRRQDESSRQEGPKFDEAKFDLGITLRVNAQTQWDEAKMEERKDCAIQSICLVDKLMAPVMVCDDSGLKLALGELSQMLLVEKLDIIKWQGLQQVFSIRGKMMAEAERDIKEQQAKIESSITSLERTHRELLTQIVTYLEGRKGFFGELLVRLAWIPLQEEPAATINWQDMNDLIEAIRTRLEDLQPQAEQDAGIQKRVATITAGLQSLEQMAAQYQDAQQILARHHLAARGVAIVNQYTAAMMAEAGRLQQQLTAINEMLAARERQLSFEIPALRIQIVALAAAVKESFSALHGRLGWIDDTEEEEGAINELISDCDLYTEEATREHQGGLTCEQIDILYTTYAGILGQLNTMECEQISQWQRTVAELGGKDDIRTDLEKTQENLFQQVEKIRRLDTSIEDQACSAWLVANRAMLTNLKQTSIAALEGHLKQGRAHLTRMQELQEKLQIRVQLRALQQQMDPLCTRITRWNRELKQDVAALLARKSQCDGYDAADLMSLTAEMQAVGTQVLEDLSARAEHMENELKQRLQAQAALVSSLEMESQSNQKELAELSQKRALLVQKVEEIWTALQGDIAELKKRQPVIIGRDRNLDALLLKMPRQQPQPENLYESLCAVKIDQKIPQATPADSLMGSIQGSIEQSKDIKEELAQFDATIGELAERMEQIIAQDRAAQQEVARLQRILELQDDPVAAPGPAASAPMGPQSMFSAKRGNDRNGALRGRQRLASIEEQPVVPDTENPAAEQGTSQGTSPPSPSGNL
jgi:hypothetical protein